MLANRWFCEPNYIFNNTHGRPPETGSDAITISYVFARRNGQVIMDGTSAIDCKFYTCE
jgi:hypothetical protein